MADQLFRDPYQLHPESVEDPPKKFSGILRQIGPGVILASAVVGSGELVATTVLGAENGYSLLWLVLLSCGIKVVVQNELGRYAIATGETALEAFDRVPGPRFRVSWVVWLWFLMQTTGLMTNAGMLAGISEILNKMVPAISISVWVWVVTVGTAILLVVGRYSLVEKVSVGMVIIFTTLTVSCAVLLFKRPEYISWGNVLDGLSFHLPQGGWVTAVAVFGITGVGSSDLVQYPYWCIEKGYARFTGLRENTEAWRERARGWTKVMGVDVLNSMAIYTSATVAFYLLGAGVLRGLGVIPKGTEMVQILSKMYTEILGGWAYFLFVVGAVAVFYSSIFAGTAAHSRVFADFMGSIGVFDKRNYAARWKVTRFFAVLTLVISLLYFSYLREPVLMVKIGGLAQAAMLPIIAFSTLYLRYTHMPKPILPKLWITLALWASSFIILVIMGYSILKILT